MVSPPLSKPLNSCHDSPGQGRGDLEYSEGNWRPWGSNQALWGVRSLLRCLCSLVDHCRPIRDQIKLCWLFILLWVCSDVLVHISQKTLQKQAIIITCSNPAEKTTETAKASTLLWNAANFAAWFVVFVKKRKDNQKYQIMTPPGLLPALSKVVVSLVEVLACKNGKILTCFFVKSYLARVW